MDSRELECVVHLEIPTLEMKIYSCINHHLICQMCLKSLPKQYCPQCMQDFTVYPPERNHLAERIVRSLQGWKIIFLSKIRTSINSCKIHAYCILLNELFQLIPELVSCLVKRLKLMLLSFVASWRFSVAGVIQRVLDGSLDSFVTILWILKCFL